MAKYIMPALVIAIIAFVVGLPVVVLTIDAIKHPPSKCDGVFISHFLAPSECVEIVDGEVVNIWE